jgi:SagB-type dehydrogenase family enzyme
VRTRRMPRVDTVPLSAIAALLHPLRSIATPVGQRRLYPSAGAIYPVRTYLSVALGRVEQLAAGVYYHDPVGHQLIAVGNGNTVRPEDVDTIVNRPIIDRSAFVLLLASHRPAIAPAYGGDALRYATLEAGAMSQMLRDAASELNLSLCMIGDAASEHVRTAAALGESEQVVAMIAGGVRDDAEEAAAIPVSDVVMEVGEL